MEWLKLGKIIEVNNFNDWLVSHTSVPVAIHLKEDIFRIFFNTRNQLNQSQTSFVDFDLGSKQIINRLVDSPIIKPGTPGSFDDAGITMSCFCPENGIYYYMGWNLPGDVPFDNQIGGAKQQSNAINKLDINPILGKCEKEPLSFGYPWVLKVKDKYFMWYDTNFFWNKENPKDYKFELRSATSTNGIDWTKTYQTNILLKDNERAIARPCVIYEDNIFKMWYSIDTNSKYTIGYSESEDGLNWTRLDDKVGIQTSSSGWDSEEIEYPFVFSHNADKYMLYNGNGYGKTGIGLAILKK